MPKHLTTVLYIVPSVHQKRTFGWTLLSYVVCYDRLVRCINDLFEYAIKPVAEIIKMLPIVVLKGHEWFVGRTIIMLS